MINVIEGNSISRVNIDSQYIVLWIERKFADEVFAKDMTSTFEVHFLV